MTSRADWADALLTRGNWPHTTSNRLALEAWIEAEGSKAAWNPLATTKRETGSTDFNTSHVQNYTSLTQGIEATYATLQSKHTDGTLRYAAILAELKTGLSASKLTIAVDSSTWGTKLANKVYLDLIALYVTRSRTAVPS